MRVRSKKNKGIRLQNYVKEQILEYFPFISEDDVKPAIMGETGEDIKLSANARQYLPYSIECKNTERLNIWKALEQASQGDYEPVVVFKRNRSEVYVALEFNEFMRLVRGNS